MFVYFLFLSKEGKKPVGKKCMWFFFFSLQENKVAINITYALFLLLLLFFPTTLLRLD